VTTSGAALPVQQRAWETRERILTAAVACLAEEGYAATTTSRIQERAGVSRGSLLHQFPSRGDLLVAAVQHLAQRRDGGLRFPDEDDPHGDIDRAVELMWSSFQGPLFRAASQLWAAAPHDPGLAAELGPSEHAIGRRNRTTIRWLFGERLADHPRFGDLISLLHTSMRGVATTYAFEPREWRDDPHLPLWRRLAHELLEA
jgi:AcrR family transcriptional regulator